SSALTRLLVDAGLRRNGRYYQAESDEVCLLVQVEPLRTPVAIYTLALTPIGARRLAVALPDSR
ncbi:hypothetical protein, partial [Rhodopseudomonas sp. B29]|uniref:hypothetical protein n=1 Tax=Rhodopseudomonas sp. B29 TaxID=95607 RepID=UPI0005935751